jgi:F-type H+-transporting ATPase subunit epsilon
VADKTFQFRLITPQGKLLDQSVSYVSMPQHDGLSGQMASHAPFVVKLGVGPLRVDVAGGGSRSFVIDGGFAQMVSNRLTILTTGAVAGETITEGDAQAELNTLNAKTPKDRAEQATIAAAKERAQVKLRVARGRAGKGI